TVCIYGAVSCSTRGAPPHRSSPLQSTAAVRSLPRSAAFSHSHPHPPKPVASPSRPPYARLGFPDPEPRAPTLYSGFASCGPRILHGVREEGGEPISPTSSWLQGWLGFPSPADLPLIVDQPRTTYKGGAKRRVRGHLSHRRFDERLLLLLVAMMR